MKNKRMRQWDGLYHGGRRVRAEITPSERFGAEEGWKIAPDEEDLISALGTDWFPEDVNRADLKKRFGLIIKREIAPTKSIDSYPYRMRLDEWGAGAEPYIDDKPWFQKAGRLVIKSLALLPFAHIVLPAFFFKRLTSGVQLAVAWGSFLAAMAGIFTLKSLIGEPGWWFPLILVGYLYICLPAIAAMFHVMLYQDKLPRPKQ